MAIRITLHGERERRQVRDWLAAAPDLHRVTLDDPARSKDQNSAMWCILGEISKMTWFGLTYSDEDWKDYFMHALKRARWMPFEDGGMVPIGMSTSKLSHKDFGDLLTIMTVFAVSHGIALKEPAGMVAA